MSSRVSQFALATAVTFGCSETTGPAPVTRASETCGITSGGLAYCWGANLYAQIGNGTYDTATTPFRVVGQR